MLEAIGGWLRRVVTVTLGAGGGRAPLEEPALAYRSPASPAPPAGAGPKLAPACGCPPLTIFPAPAPLHTTEADMAAWREALRRTRF